MVQVGKWDPSTIHIQNFPQEFLFFLNNYMASSNMTANNAAIGRAYTALILGSDQSPGPMSAVGYQSSDPIGTPITAANGNSAFYMAQIVQAVDARGMGPIVNTTANTMTV